ncbi:MAG: response regulator [Rubrivivax sp.]|nr:response regulator [Pyrinomonadaceae bacterium]
MLFTPAEHAATAMTLAPTEFQDEMERRILIVDDEEAVRKLFHAFLSDDYICTTAPSAEDALALLAVEPYALVLSDMMMPGRNGIELLREVTARYPDTVVIMCSGVDRTQRVLDAVRLGAYDYLVKPCDLDVLSLTIERALERRALLRSARHYKLDLERHNDELRRSRNELQRLQSQIVQSEKMASLGQLAAGVAHELNNPAGFIYGNIEILDECTRGVEQLLSFYETVPLTEEMSARARQIKDSIDYENTLADLRSIITDCREGAERIRDVVQNLRTFSRLDEAEFKKVDIHEGLESTLRLLSRYYSADNVTLARDYGELPLVDCYAGQLNQVWLNLLVNAAHAVKEGGEVRIKTRREAGMVVVTISDTGYGIEPENLRRIFDPFFTTKPIGEGTGLGLSVTYSIIERHRGNIGVESKPGEGTTFTVAIPVDAPRDATGGGR